ncbi:hypothetical protein [Microcoleus sp. herbarium2]|uniref:hypothetical protein n=1 Tax=Microcoleus sp. herbarium2 TaxID=3055433 RepID=UPI002FD18ECC
MQFVINECSFIGQATDSVGADELIVQLYDIIKEIEPIKGDNPIQTYSNFSNQKLAQNLTIHDWLFQTLNSNDENRRKVAKVFLQIIRKGPFIDLQDDFKKIIASHKCYLNKQDLSTSSLLCVAYLQEKLKLISLQKAPDFASEYLHVKLGIYEQSLELIKIHNLTTAEQAKKIRPIYKFNPKHHHQAKGNPQKPHTPMDLTDKEAQKVLDNSIESSSENSNKRYGYHREKDRYYIFHPDNASNQEGYFTYHGFPVEETQVPDCIINQLLR